VRSRRRLRAVLLVGVTGYGTALLFVAHGAPDLALTQILVETFLLVTFVLVLRRLPPFFSDRPFNLSRWVRVAIGVAAGTAVAGFALVTADARTAEPVSQGFAEPAYDYGGGKNIVNVTLVDIRAWDTLGELSVLVVAATGVASLIFLITDRSRRPRRPTLDSHADDDAPVGRWLRSARAITDSRRSVVFEIVTRLIFHAVIVFSIYLMLVGHNLPGGGFAGGLVAGLALMIRYLAGGRAELDEAAPVDAGIVLGTGLATAALSGLLPTLLGGGVLQSAIVDIDIPVLGTLHLVTSVFFDIGVYLVVVGLALDVLRSLGSGIDAQIDAAEREATA
jgi:multicomponent Na+:H+ antiporter subunit A